MRSGKFLIYFTLLFSIPILKAQPASYKVIALEMDKNFSFPIFSNPKDTQTSNKINHFLQLSELELIHGYEKKNPFERVAIDLINPIPGKTLIQYQINQNNSQLLSLTFTQSFCGSGCNYWCTYYNFNPANGELIYLKDLFTPQGFIDFSKQVLNVRLDKYEKIKNRTDTTQRKELEAMKQCYYTDPLQTYYIKHDSIFLDRSLCFGKSILFAEMNPLEGYPLSQFNGFLSEYGKIVFGQKTGYIMDFHSRQLPQLFRGKIGQDSILFLLNYQPQENFTGIYFNLKNGVSKQITGSYVKDEILFVETDIKQNEKGKIIARFAGNNIEGMHYNKADGKKSFFIIHP